MLRVCFESLFTRMISTPKYSSSPRHPTAATIVNQAHARFVTESKSSWFKSSKASMHVGIGVSHRSGVAWGPPPQEKMGI